MQMALRQPAGTHPANARGLGRLAALLAREVARAQDDKITGEITATLHVKSGLIQMHTIGSTYQERNECDEQR
jgi:hypothetical protein